MPTATSDVIVIGAGIAGAATARECARRGMRVTVVEHAVPGGATTAAGMGHIVAMDDSPAQLALTQYARALWQAEPLPKAAEYEERGTLWVAADDEELAEAHTRQQRYGAAGIAAQVLDAKAIAEAEPQLRKDLAGGLRVPHDAVMYPPVAAQAFLAEARALGATFVPARAVRAARGEVQLTDGTCLHAGALVTATGTDTSLLPALPVDCIVPRKGHLLITDRYPGFVQHQLVELGYLKSAHASQSEAPPFSVAFNVQPRSTGQLLIGSSRQFGSHNPAVEQPVLAAMIARATHYLPRLGTLSTLRAWTGFRAATPDHLPLIGSAHALTGDPSLWLAMGFEGLGITCAPGAAQLIADALTGVASAIDPAPYQPARMLQKVLHG